jgi:hypothetical protein
MVEISDFVMEQRNACPELLGFWTSFHRQVFYELEHTTFRKLDLFPISGVGGGRHLLSCVP